MIAEILALRREAESQGGKVIRITLDKEGNKALRNELSVPASCKHKVLGIIIDQVAECPACGQEIEVSNAR